MVRASLQDSAKPYELEVVGDGEEAMDYLLRRGKYVDAHRPDLILLDLNLPRKDGREVLEEVKSSTDLRSIPVIILSTSKAEEDVMRTYNLHGNCFVTKPIDMID